jgi:hypothetical protein
MIGNRPTLIELRKRYMCSLCNRGQGLVIILLILGFLSGCRFDLLPVTNHVLISKESPDGKLKAVVFECDGGATSRTSLGVSILGVKRSLPDKGGNVFNCGEVCNVQVEWLAPRTLRIAHDCDLSVQYLVVSRIGHVSILYESLGVQKTCPLSCPPQ